MKQFVQAMTLGVALAIGGNLPIAPAAENELVMPIFRDGALDEIDAASYTGPHFLFKMIYEGLVEDGGEGKIIPVLATSWDIAEDGKTYTFHLRRGVKFSDGTDFDADAVIFNMKRWINNDRYSALVSSRVEAMEALDKYTVKIVFAEPAYSILMEQTYPRPVRFLSPASIEPDAEKPLGRFTRPVGTGPWMVESYDKEHEFTLVPNPHYWGEKPKLDRIRFKVAPDAQARLLALQSGEVDIVGGDLVGKIPLESIPQLMADPSLEVVTKGTLCSHLIAFNNDNGKFSDKNLRLAINYAVDKKVIAEHLFDNVGQEAQGLYRPGVPYVTDQNSYGYPGDKEKARHILDQAGYLDTDGDGVREKDGKTLEYRFVLSASEFPEWKALAEFVQYELAQVGIKINLHILDQNGYSETTLWNRMFDMAFMRTASDSWMPHSSLLELFAPFPTPDRPAKVWTDAHLFDLITATLTTLDPQERQKKYDQVFGYISEQALCVPLYYPITSFAYNPDRVKHFEIGVNNYAPLAWEKLEVVSE